VLVPPQSIARTTTTRTSGLLRLLAAPARRAPQSLGGLLYLATAARAPAPTPAADAAGATMAPPLSAAKALAAAAIISPVPDDIDIAQAVAPAHIAAIAESLGLGEEEYDLYGRHKAKARAVCRRCPLPLAAPALPTISPFRPPALLLLLPSWKCGRHASARPPASLTPRIAKN
jgi:hypothetical protein